MNRLTTGIAHQILRRRGKVPRLQQISYRWASDGPHVTLKNASAGIGYDSYRKPDDPDKYEGQNFRDATKLILNSMAERFALCYEFKYDQTLGPTMEDLMRARDGEEGKDWDYGRYEEDGFDIFCEEVAVCKGDKVPWWPLQKVYTEEKWEFIREMMDYAAGDESIPMTRDRVKRLSQILHQGV